MSDTTLGLSYDQLRIRVAEYLSIAYYGSDGTGAAQIPVDTHDLDLVGRLVNDGYARFLNESVTGWRFMTVPLSITFGTGTVGTDNARYYLPDDTNGILNSPWTYGSDGPLRRIDWIDEAGIRELIAATDTTTGPPVRFTVRAIDTDNTDTSQRWEAVFWPTPDGTETVTTTYKRVPDALSSSSDHSVAGPVHDRTVLLAALAAAELQRNGKIGPMEAAYQVALAQSKKLDARSAPASLGGYGDRGNVDYIPRRFSISYSGTSVF